MLTGVFSVLPTPFGPTGDLDLPGLRRVIDLYLRAGVDGLTALGVTSETARLSDAERRMVLDAVMAHVDRRVPVVVGTSADGLHKCLDLSRQARDSGAAAAMISPPRMPKLNSEAVVHHYRTVADAVGLPVVIQDYPPSSGFSMEPQLLARIAREVPSARTIKLEDPPTPLKTARVREHAGDLPLGILGGLGGMYLYEELAAGANGVMTGFAVPEVLVRVFRQFQAGRQGDAADDFYRSVAMMRFEFQEGAGLAIRKEILRRRGAIASATTRPPGAPLDGVTESALETLLRWFCQHNPEISWTLD